MRTPSESVNQSIDNANQSYKTPNFRETPLQGRSFGQSNQYHNSRPSNQSDEKNILIDKDIGDPSQPVERIRPELPVLEEEKEESDLNQNGEDVHPLFEEVKEISFIDDAVQGPSS